MRIFVLGYLGVLSYEHAQKIASELNSEAQKNWPDGFFCKEKVKLSREEMLSIKESPVEVLDLNREIERLDGRSLVKICMGHGEHAYRNCEYEVLSKIVKPDFSLGLAREEKYPENLIVACGDGIVLDEMCYEIIYSQRRIVLELPVEEMWQNAKNDKTLPYAYLQFGSEEERFGTFVKNYEMRRKLYDSLK